jgi:hypothetical protein
MLPELEPHPASTSAHALAPAILIAVHDTLATYSQGRQSTMDEPCGTVLKRSAPPSGRRYDGHSEWDDKPVRLEVTCQRDGNEPWIVLAEVVPTEAGDP